MVFCFLEGRPKSTPVVQVGIDYGTAYTGAAIGLGNSPEKLRVIDINSWPALDGRRISLQVPSQCFPEYYSINTSWGYQCNLGDEKTMLRGMKHLLNDGQDTDYEPALESKLLLEQYGKTSVQAIGDYLRQVVENCHHWIRHEYGIEASAWKRHYWLTVPTACTEGAHDAFKTAAGLAGIDLNDMTIVWDMEAAVFDCFCGPKAVKTKKDDVLMVVDAGALETRLTSWKIRTKPQVKHSLVTQGTKGAWGSASLDQNFENLLIKIFGHSSYVQLSDKARQTAMRHWQDIVKPSFGQGLEKDDKKKWFQRDQPDITYRIPLPDVADDPWTGVKGGFLLLEKSQIQGIFDPVIQQIKCLLDTEISRVAAAGEEVKVIALVSGLGSSQYLLQKLKAAYPHIKVVQPPNAWSSVARGAIVQGLLGGAKENSPMKSRIAERHYGIMHQTIFDHKIHREEDKFWNYLEEKYVATNQMKWYIRKGDVILQDTPFAFQFYRSFSKEHPLSGWDNLYACDKDEAPRTFEKDLYIVGTARFNFASLPDKNAIKRENSKGVKYNKVDYAIFLTPNPSSMLFEYLIKDESYGKTEIKY